MRDRSFSRVRARSPVLRTASFAAALVEPGGRLRSAANRTCWRAYRLGMVLDELEDRDASSQPGDIACTIRNGWPQPLADQYRTPGARQNFKLSVTTRQAPFG